MVQGLVGAARGCQGGKSRGECGAGAVPGGGESGGDQTKGGARGSKWGRPGSHSPFPFWSEHLPQPPAEPGCCGLRAAAEAAGRGLLQRRQGEGHPGGQVAGSPSLRWGSPCRHLSILPALGVQGEHTSFSFKSSSFSLGSPTPAGLQEWRLGQNFPHCRWRPTCGHEISLVGHSSVCYIS